jgi:ComEC/Rec2-related protein
MFFRKKKCSPKQQGIIEWFTLGLIWGYALLTGGSDSVLRSACMLSVWRLFRAFKLPLFSIDAVFISAIILLFYDPTMLFHTGFQLSYGAVLGILILYPPIYKWVVFKQKKTIFLKLKKYLWGMTSVGIAAQIGVLPLSFFYFKKVAVLFWLVNPIVLTCASFLLPAGLLLLFLHTIHFWTVAQYLGLGLSKITEAMFWFLQKVETLSFLNIQINLNTLANVILLYIIFYLIFLSCSYKSFSLRVAVFIAVILFCCVQIFQQYSLKSNLILTHTKDNIVFIFSNAWEKHIVFTKKIHQQKDSLRWMEQISQYRGTHQKIKTYTISERNHDALENGSIFYKDGLLMMFGYKIFIVPEYFEKLTFQENIVDYLIFPHQKNKAIENLHTYFRAKRKFICNISTYELPTSWEVLYYNTVKLE